MFLKKHNISSFLLDARLLLQHVLNQPAEFLVREPNHLCTHVQLQEYELLLNRRVHHEPISKIIGVKEFWGLSFMVTQDVLDPRPDSETLIESVREKFPNTNRAYQILDLGVGSGCLLLSLLHDYPNATGVGVDISSTAIRVAHQNACSLGLNQRVQFVKDVWGQGIQEHFDIVVSNPPYIPSQVIPSLDPEVNQFDPILALDGGSDGLDCYRVLTSEIARLLKLDGYLFIEIGQGQERDIEIILKSSRLKLLTWKKDLHEVPRCGIFSRDD